MLRNTFAFCTYTLTVNMLPIGFGMVAGWASPNIMVLTSDDSPLATGKITMEQASSVASFVPLGIAGKRIFHLNSGFFHEMIIEICFAFQVLCLVISCSDSSQTNSDEKKF